MTFFEQRRRNEPVGGSVLEAVGSGDGRNIPPAEVPHPVVVVAKIGIRGKGKVRTQEGIYEVKAADDGWLTVSGPPPEGPGSVRYLDERDLLEIERRGGTFSIHFRPELEQTRFELNGHVYEVATTDFGHISIAEGSRPVVRGHGTVSGVRLLAVAPDLAPFERELAFGFALRLSAQDKDLWDEDHPLLARWGL